MNQRNEEQEHPNEMPHVVEVRERPLMNVHPVDMMEMNMPNQPSQPTGSMWRAQCELMTQLTNQTQEHWVRNQTALIESINRNAIYITKIEEQHQIIAQLEYNNNQLISQIRWQAEEIRRLQENRQHDDIASLVEWMTGLPGTGEPDSTVDV